MTRIHIQYYKTRAAEFVIGSYSEQLCLLDFRYRKMRAAVDNRLKRGLAAEFVERDDEILVATRDQLDQYFLGERRQFDLPLLLVGSEFQKTVWRALMDVHYGTTSSYLELAKIIQRPTSVRAVASANGANAIAIIIPCHRIIGSDGQLVGYGGGLALKQRLLSLENNLFS